MSKSIVSLIPLASYDDQTAVDDAVRRALEPFGGMEAFLTKGKRVLLKPNLVVPAKTDHAITTHPAIVRAVIRLINECGGSIDIGDGPGVSNATAVCKACGIMDVAQEEKATVVDFIETAEYENLENRVAKHLSLTDQIKAHDVLITLPKLKTHCLMAMTCALKNQYGLIPGVAKSHQHFRFQDRDAFADLIIDINRTAHPALAIVDAVIGMEGPGPSGGTPRKIGVIIVGTDLAAVDTVAATLITLPVEQSPILMAARRAQFGATRLEDIDIRGASIDDFIVHDYKLVKAPSNIMRILPLPQFMLRWLRHQIIPVPQIESEKCIRCGRCRKGCPARPEPAINPFATPLPTVNEKTCIRCYCCHEFCPAKAIMLKRSFLDRHFHILAIIRALHSFCGKFLEIFNR